MNRRVVLLSFASLLVILVSFGLLAIPQFILENGTNHYDINGYQFFFNAGSDLYKGSLKPQHVSGLGIASIVLMALAIVSYVFAYQSSAFSLFGGLLSVASSVLFFCMNLSKNEVYGHFRSRVEVGWVAYVIGGLLVVSGLLAIYGSIKLMLQEKKVIASSKSYSYIKK